MPNKGTSKHLNSVQYFTLFVQSKSQMYLRDLTRDCACIAVRHNRVAERSWLHCSCENGVPWIHLPGYHHFSHENCHNDTPGPPCPSPASWPVKEGSDLPKSTSIFKCYICIYNILYIYTYIPTRMFVSQKELKAIPDYTFCWSIVIVDFQDIWWYIWWYMYIIYQMS
jgi:hypothetical protein